MRPTYPRKSASITSFDRTYPERKVKTSPAFTESGHMSDCQTPSQPVPGRRAPDWGRVTSGPCRMSGRVTCVARVTRRRGGSGVSLQSRSRSSSTCLWDGSVAPREVYSNHRSGGFLFQPAIWEVSDYTPKMNKGTGAWTPQGVVCLDTPKLHI